MYVQLGTLVLDLWTAILPLAQHYSASIPQGQLGYEFLFNTLSYLKNGQRDLTYADVLPEYVHQPRQSQVKARNL